MKDDDKDECDENEEDDPEVVVKARNLAKVAFIQKATLVRLVVRTNEVETYPDDYYLQLHAMLHEA